MAKQGGVLTPATIGGEIIAERLVKYSDFSIKGLDVSNAKDVSKAVEQAKSIATSS